jgi:hypothetical protein
MFELTRETLLYILIALSTILVILLVLIFRKRGLLGGRKSDEVPKPPVDETGPTDHDAIKETLKKEKPKEAPSPPAPPQKPEKKEEAPDDEKETEPAESPFPIEPGDMDMPLEGMPQGEAEVGLDLEELEKSMKPKRRAWEEQAPPAPQKRREEREDVGFVDLGEGKGAEEEAPAKEEKKGFMGKIGRGAAKKPEKAGRGRADEEVPEPPARPAARAEPLSTADIMGSPDGFLGHTVAIEGEVKLSSRGPEDSWYMLFDGRGSAVVRSKEEIPYPRARILAKVEKTRLGQVYLEVMSFTKA